MTDNRSETPSTDQPDDTNATDDNPQQVVVTPEGGRVEIVMNDGGTGPGGGPAAGPGGAGGAGGPAGPGAEGRNNAIEEPAKVMRIGGMIKRLLEEVRDAPLDDAARTRLAEIHERSLAELEEGLSPDLVEELHRITLPFNDEGVPSDAELRVAQAQLVGWLEGLFHGIQTALVVQQMAAQQQLTQMRHALPPGTIPMGIPGQAGPGQQAPGAAGPSRTVGRRRGSTSEPAPCREKRVAR